MTTTHFRALSDSDALRRTIYDVSVVGVDHVQASLLDIAALVRDGFTPVTIHGLTG